MENKDYSLKVDESGNVTFQFDKACNSFYGSPISATSKTSVELIPATKNEPAALVKTTVIKEKYKLKEREIKKEDLEFALTLIGMHHSMLTINLLPFEDNLIPGTISLFRVNKVKDRDDLFKVFIDLQYDQYFEGELESKKIKERGAFLMNKEKLEQTYDSFKNLTIKDSISLLQALKQLFKEILIPEESESVRAQDPNKEKIVLKEKERDDDDELVR